MASSSSLQEGETTGKPSRPVTGPGTPRASGRVLPVRKTGLAISKGSPSALVKEAKALQRRRALEQTKDLEKGAWETVGMDEDCSEATDPEQDQKEMASGKISFAPVLAQWRRMALRIIFTVAAKMAMMSANQIGGEAVPEEALECDHPKHARRRGANQYAVFEHCRKCKTRLWIERRTPQEMEALLQRARDRRHEDRDRSPPPQLIPDPPPLNIRSELVYKKEVPTRTQKTPTTAFASNLKPSKNDKVTAETDSAAESMVKALQENNKAIQQMAVAVQALATRSR